MSPEQQVEMFAQRPQSPASLHGAVLVRWSTPNA